MKNIIILTFAFWLGLTNSPYAQSTLTGRITDPQGAPLAGATIFLPEISKGTISDTSGNYILHKLPNGKNSIQFSYLGYTSFIERVLLHDTTFRLDVILEPTVIRSEEIVVTGGYNSTQHENAVKIEVFDANLLENRPSPSFASMLTSIPGVDMISKGSGIGKPVIRGLSMNDILVLYHGLRYENYQYSSHHPLGIDEFGISDVEIIKGPASLLYGSDAIGGVVNFIREKPAPAHHLAGDYALQLFSNSQGISQQLGIKGASDRFFAGIRAGQKIHADYLQGGGDYVPNSRFNSHAIKTSLGYTGKKGSFSLYYDYSRETPGLVEEEAVDLITQRGRKPDHYFQQFTTHLLTSQNMMYLGRMKLDINGGYQSTELTHFGENSLNELQMRLGTLSYEAKLHLPSDIFSEYILGFQGSNQQNTNLHNRETILLPDAETNNYSGFILVQRTFLRKVKLQLGSRVDHRRLESIAVGSASDSLTFRPALSRSYNSISGSAGATWFAGERLLLRANIASAYRNPNLAELSSKGVHEIRFELGDSQLKSEKSIETDLSMHYHQENMTFDLALFYNSISHYIFLTPTSDTTSEGISVYRYRQENAILQGGEAGIHLHPTGLPWMHLASSFALVIGEMNNGEFLPFIPAPKINFEFRAEKEKLWFAERAFLAFNTTQTLKQERTASDEMPTDAWFLADWITGGVFTIGRQKVEMVIGINNLFDRKYIDHLSTLKEAGFFNPGRNFTFSLKLPFGRKLE
ncbi:MAG: TonB-dependent receptor [Bacteroidales bacterium]